MNAMMNTLALIADLFFPQPVTRDRLGTLGGNPHFLPPDRDVASDMQQGIGPNGPYTHTSREY
jgi:hypothetical protein